MVCMDMLKGEKSCDKELTLSELGALSYKVGGTVTDPHIALFHIPPT